MCMAPRLKGIATNNEEEEEDEDESGGVSRFQEAMSNLSDALLPVRGHGLIELTKLLDEADPETVSNAARVVDALRENLEDDDTYIYLQASLDLLFHQLLAAALAQLKNREISSFLDKFLN